MSSDAEEQDGGDKRESEVGMNIFLNKRHNYNDRI